MHKIFAILIFAFGLSACTNAYGQDRPKNNEITQIPELEAQTCWDLKDCKAEKQKRWFMRQWDVDSKKCLGVLAKGKEIRSFSDMEGSDAFFVYENALW